MVNQLNNTKTHVEFISHQLPKGLAVDEAILLGKETVKQTEQLDVPANDDVTGNEKKEM